ncbi:hypothetical protein HYH03_015522 [Edaphochlamys debaryana]|uniref:BTB domain-containing protein n=1 Tax=Edaphochlamys debaryana TaxID=47281 RepID=A0A835XM31_9CHLO|nr:hypothetical protein HYH03_015522 [Edaphochlamys debaryana]|eukprot:KAG2485812.1 hypothetical protein HYH03_015522 [Edaphochlamys debaryana]
MVFIADYEDAYRVYRLTKDNRVQLLAGEEVRARNRPWAFLFRLSALVADGAGSIYCVSSAEEDYVLRLQMPAAWSAAASVGAAAPPGFLGLGQLALPAAAEAEVDPAHGPAEVTLVRSPQPAVPGQAWVPSRRAPWQPGFLAMASHTAIYRTRRPASGAEGGDGGPDAEAGPELWVGAEDEEGTVDGQGQAARFHSICGMVADASGVLYVLDYGPVQGGKRAGAIRRVASDGTVTTVISGLPQGCREPAILPNGRLAFCSAHPPSLTVLDLGLKLPHPRPPPTPKPVGPLPRTLAVDLGALLDGQPEGSWDVTIVVGDCRFPAHRLILSARSDYFRHRLTLDTFADGAAAELSLPDADPDAFELLLRYIYTGAADIPPALAPAVAVLADRLLLPLLCADAQAAVLSAVTAESVAESLLWAERLGGGFSGLLSSLKAWFLEHFEEVHEAAPGSLERLSAESPKLMVELHLGVARSAKRQRTGGS